MRLDYTEEYWENNKSMFGEWFDISRKGDTGVGHAVESLLGISENNFSLADFQYGEVKTQTSDNSRLTLFCMAPTWPPKASKTFVTDFGHYDQAGTKRFYGFTNESEYHFKANTSCVAIQGKIEPLAYWDSQVVEQKLEKKLPVMSVLHTERHENKAKINGVTIYSKPSYENLTTLINDKKAIMEFRVKMVGAKVRDRGTALRVNQAHVPFLFGSKVYVS